LPDDENRAQFAQLVLPHLDAAYNLARWLMRHEQDAEDIVQEAFLRAWRSFAGFHGTDGRPWLLAIVRNTCYSALDRIRSNAARALDEAHPEERQTMARPNDPLIEREEAASIAHAMEKLTPEFREVLILREFEELSYKQIAAVIHAPIGTVMSRLARAREQLATILSDQSTKENLT
jgi:RNA polymerase sigma-70 factor (ECF subfamily)